MQQSNSTPVGSGREQFIDFGALLARYRRYWWLFVLSLAVCLSLCALYLTVKKPLYLVVSTLLVDQGDNAGSAGASLLKSFALGGGGGKVDDEVVVVGSQELRRKMVGRLKLNRAYTERRSFLDRIDHYNSSPIEVQAPDELFDTLSTSMQFRIDVDAAGKADITVKKGFFKTLTTVNAATLPATVRTPYGLFVVSTTPFYRPGKPVAIRAQVSGNNPKAEALTKKMTVKVLSKKSNAIYMDVPDNNVQRGRDMLNTIIALYNERGQAEKDAQALNTGRFIDERLGLIYKELTASEADIEAYKRAHNIVDVQLQTKSLVGKQAQAEQALVSLETRRRIVGMIKDFVSNPDNKGALIPFSADSTAASGAIAAYNRLVMQRMELAASARDNNQAMQQLDSQIETMRRNVLTGVNNTLGALAIQQAQMQTVNQSSSGTMNNIPTEEREVLALYRQQGIQNAIYTFLLQKREENALVLAATTPKGKIVDSAYAKTEPIAPNKAVNIFAALLAGLLIPVVLLYFKGLLTTKFTNEDELSALTTIPVVGHLHHNRHGQDLVVRSGKTSALVELFRYVRNNIQFMLSGTEGKTVLVTSSISGEGKSFIGLNLAAAFALLGKRVALVGMDVRSPQLANMVDGLHSGPGVTTFLSQPQTTITDIAQRCPDMDGLDIIVGGAIPPNPSELLLSNRTAQLMADLRAAYDIIVIDSAPVAMVSDTFALTRFADFTLYVTRANYTRRSMVRYLNRLVAERQLNNVGLVINDTKPNQENTYGQGYGTTTGD